MTFQERLTQQPEALQAQKVKYAVSRNLRQLEANEDATDARIDELQQAIETGLGSRDVNWETIAKFIDELEYQNKVLKVYADLKTELFPAEKA